MTTTPQEHISRLNTLAHEITEKIKNPENTEDKIMLMKELRSIQSSIQIYTDMINP